MGSACILQRFSLEAPLNSTILVVDTSHPVVHKIAGALANAGFEPSGAYSYAEAVQRLQESVPDVLVVSVELGSHNGLQLALRCFRSHPATRVIVIGPQSASLEGDASAVGASAYMPRPLTTDALIERLNGLGLLPISGTAGSAGADTGSGMAANA